MKYSLISLAVAAGLAVAGTAQAAPTVYGNAHLSLNAADNDVPGASNNLKVSSNTSAIGVKGSEDLGDGLKALYKLEFQVGIGAGPDTTPDTGPLLDSQPGGLSGRDQWVGLKGGMGKVAFGSMSSNYKQMGGKVDPMYRTPLEGRGFLGTQSSALHGGKGINRGRQTHTAQYTSPSFGGISVVVNTTFSGSEDETTGLGVRYKTKNIMVYFDTISGRTATNNSAPTPVNTIDCLVADGCTTESATKVGGKFSGKGFSISGQIEQAEDRVMRNYMFLAGSFSIDKNNTVMASYGTASDESVGGTNDHDGFALMLDHKMSKQTNVYVGYGAHGEDAVGADTSMLTAGIRKKF